MAKNKKFNEDLGIIVRGEFKEIWWIKTEVLGTWILQVDLPLDMNKATRILKVIVSRCQTIVDLKYDFLMRYGKLLSFNSSTG